MIEGKLIHIFNDDKFVDVAIKLFEQVLPNHSTYWIIGKKEQPFKYVKSSIAFPLQLNGEETTGTILEQLNLKENSIVCIHALDTSKQKLIHLLPDSMTKVWFLWGFDLYQKWPLLKKTLLDSDTRKAIGIASSLKDQLIFNSSVFTLFKKRNLLKFLIPKKMKRFLENNFDTLYYKTVNKIDIVAPVLPLEYEWVKQMNPSISYGSFTYGSIEDLLGDNRSQNVQMAHNILVGNSADPTNNHLAIFKKLSKMNLDNRKVIVPLSYAGNNSYLEQVLQEGRYLLKDNFYPITEFMSLEDYNKILLSCGTVIFNHVRQQGIGNCIAMGYLGAKLYVNPQSPTYKYYKQEGIVLFSTNQLTSAHFVKPLSDIEYQKNKRVFYKLYGLKTSRQKVVELLNVCERVQNTKRNG